MLCLSSSLISCSYYSQATLQHKNYVGAGIVVGNQFPSSPLAGVYGNAGFYFYSFDRVAALDFTAKEVGLLNPQQQGTLLTITYRLNVVKGFYVGVGAAHGHQIAMAHYLEHPVAASMGNHPQIVHTSGLHADVSYVFKPLIHKTKFGIYPYMDIGYTHLFSTTFSWPNLTGSAGLRIGFKRWK